MAGGASFANLSLQLFQSALHCAGSAQSLGRHDVEALRFLQRRGVQDWEQASACVQGALAHGVDMQRCLVQESGGGSDELGCTTDSAWVATAPHCVMERHTADFQVGTAAGVCPGLSQAR